MHHTWDLAVAVIPPPGVGPVMRAGAAESVVSALDDLDLDVDYYTPADDPDLAGVVLVGVDPGGETQEGLLARVTAVVESLIAATPELAGWGHRVDVTVPVGIDLVDDADGDIIDLDVEIAGLLPDGDALAEQLAQDIAVERSVYDDARWFTALPADLLVVEVLADLPEREQEAARRRATALAGCLVQAAGLVTDQLFEDVEALAGVEEPDHDDIADTWILSSLPPRLAGRYGSDFARRFLVATVDVTARLTAGWTPLACVAQELALRVLLDQTELVAELADVELSEGWRKHLEEHLFEDLDHEMLYDPSLDGIEDDPSAQPPGTASMRFEDWFTPFNEERTLPPYALPG
jgi:hypothetical protein